MCTKFGVCTNCVYQTGATSAFALKKSKRKTAQLSFCNS